MHAPTPAKSPQARAAHELVQNLQRRLVDNLATPGDSGRFEAVSWLRDEGRHGGGMRFAYSGGNVFNRASVNVSQVHYDDLAEKPLGSANAISSIVHPMHPAAPSIHIHISWTGMKDDTGYWRIMADLNPSMPDPDDTKAFLNTVRDFSGKHFDLGIRFGEQYFAIPTLGRHRGVAHYYLEQFKTADERADFEFARTFGEQVIDTYGKILHAKLADAGRKSPTARELRMQLDYHTLYLFQVLTLDRGTTSGLIVHDQNDLGILGSLPAVVDVDLLKSWIPRMTAPQDELLRALVAVLPADGRVNDLEKLALCQAVRQHYRKHPAALELQARADVVPPTVRNHL